MNHVSRARARLLTLSCIAALMITPCALAQATVGAGRAPIQQGPREDALADDVARVRALFDIPGVAIAVVKDGKVLAARGFGKRRAGAAAMVDGQTLFGIGANSKAFTAALLAMLVDEGKLAWDDPVVKHLPAFQMFDPLATREMTIRDLLSNRSGLGVAQGDLLWWPTSTFSADEIIDKLRLLPPAKRFGSTYTYEYLPFIVAAKIIEQKTGKTWGEAVRERILAPLGMTHTATSAAESEGAVAGAGAGAGAGASAGWPNLAAPHSDIDGKLTVIAPVPMANAAGAMGIHTSAQDIAKWMRLLLDGGTLATPGADGKPRRLLSAAQARELWTPQTLIPVREPKPQLAATRANFAASGMGFEMRDYKGVKLVVHGGWEFGFYSTVLMVPSAKLGIAILTNAESSAAINALKYQLLDRYLGIATTDWIKAVGDAEAAVESQSATATATAAAQNGAHAEQAGATQPAASSPSLALAAYNGAYRDPWYGSATIKAVGATQVLSFSWTPGLTGTLTHYQHDTFIVRWKERSYHADAYVTFSLNPDGSIERMKMAPISSETDTSFDFGDLSFIPVKPAAR